jgi:putative transposase
VGALPALCREVLAPALSCERLSERMRPSPGYHLGAMMDSRQFDECCQRLGLPEPGRALMQNIREAEPARRVQSRRSNAVVRYTSKKMKRIIQAESHTVELPLVYLLEHSRDVLEYFDQPYQIKLSYKTAEGRAGGFLHVPDYFVIYQDRAGFYECKPAAAMEDLAKEMPWRFQRDPQGKWTCPPGVAFTNPLGLFYQIWTPDEVSPVLIRNLRFLEDYFQRAE